MNLESPILLGFPDDAVVNREVKVRVNNGGKREAVNVSDGQPNAPLIFDRVIVVKVELRRRLQAYRVRIAMA